MRQIAFTLMELLVVISIIALLAAMLLPAISMVRNAAKDMTCRAHLRQVQLGALGYAADQDGKAVPGMIAYDFWHVYLAPYVEAEKGPPEEGYAPNNIRQTSSVLWGCPNRRLLGNMDHTWAPGYGINVWLMEPVRSSAPATAGWRYGNSYEWEPSVNSWIGAFRDFHVATITHASQRAWWSDGPNWMIGFRDGIAADGSSIYRHNNHGNTMFVDGHVQATKDTENTSQSVDDPSQFNE